ncbi:MAG: polysaccharide deacetylase family protein [Candidatus Bathyarchaeota archaeon]|nr:polysaccharide deacetylase family protein [Candidatus Bathyarchaeota archaeon]
MKSKGTASLLVVLTLSAVILFTTGINNAPVAPSPPTQVYQPTIPSADQKVAVIVFDDGWESQLNAIPIMDNYGFKASFAIVTSYVGYPDFMDWQQVAQIAQKGNDIVSHTHTHQNLSIANPETLNNELAKSQQILRSKGYATDILIYPYGEGFDNETVRDATAQHYLLARGTKSGKCNLSTADRYGLKSYGIYHNITSSQFASYVNGTKGSTISILFYHKIGNGTDDMSITEETFQEQMQYLRDNNFTVKTMSQLFLKPQPQPTN